MEAIRDTVDVHTDNNFKVQAIAHALDYKMTVKDYSFFASFPAGVELGINTLKGYVNDMKYVFTKEGAKSVGGFATADRFARDIARERLEWADERGHQSASAASSPASSSGASWPTSWPFTSPTCP